MINNELQKTLNDAKQHFESLPLWKQKLVKEMMDELAKPYEQHRRYPVTRDGTVI